MEPFPPPASLNRAVLVTNLSLLATDSDLEEVFSFCGKIAALQIRRGSPTAQAVVVFDSRSAQMAALLLNDTSILNQKVKVLPAPETWMFKEGDSDASEEPHPADSDAQQSSNGTAPVAAISSWWGRVAQSAQSAARAVETNERLWEVVQAAEQAAATAGERALQAAQVAGERGKDVWGDLDTKYNVGERATAAVQTTKDGVRTMDQKIGLSSAAAQAGSAVTAVARELDENLQVTQKANQLRSRALENDVIRSGVEAVSESWDDIAGRIGPEVERPGQNALDGDFVISTPEPPADSQNTI